MIEPEIIEQAEVWGLILVFGVVFMLPWIYGIVSIYFDRVKSHRQPWQ